MTHDIALTTCLIYKQFGIPDATHEKGNHLSRLLNITGALSSLLYCLALDMCTPLMQKSREVNHQKYKTRVSSISGPSGKQCETMVKQASGSSLQQSAEMASESGSKV